MQATLDWFKLPRTSQKHTRKTKCYFELFLLEPVQHYVWTEDSVPGQPSGHCKLHCSSLPIPCRTMGLFWGAVRALLPKIYSLRRPQSAGMGEQKEQPACTPRVSPLVYEVD